MRSSASCLHLEAQHKAHSAFIDKISKINLEDVDEHQQDYLEHIVQFLLDWLTVHILHMDKKIGEFAAANGFIQTPDSPSEEWPGAAQTAAKAWQNIKKQAFEKMLAFWFVVCYNKDMGH